MGNLPLGGDEIKRRLRRLWQADEEFICDEAAWKSAPTTLTCLSLTGPELPELSESLPASITTLQLTEMYDQDSEFIDQVVTALPQLTSMNLGLCTSSMKSWNDMLKPLSRLTNLQSLGIQCSDTYRHKILSTVPAIAKAVKQGMERRLKESFKELYKFYEFSEIERSAWATQAV